jgi:hypothetical protein
MRDALVENFVESHFGGSRPVDSIQRIQGDFQQRRIFPDGCVFNTRPEKEPP